MPNNVLRVAVPLLIFFTAPLEVLAQDGTSEEELAKQLANPISSLISVPFQLNYDQDIGPLDDGDRYTLNIQPVVPFSLNDDWNLISRTILPLVSQSDIAPGSGSQNGTGDIVQSLFFSPVAPTGNGWIWGVGPAFLIPTGSNDLLTADKWAAGPTAVALKQQGPWTFGALANHLWSFAGESDRDDISSTFLQPFLSYTTPTATSYTLQTESTFNWKSDEWQVPIAFVVGKVSRIGNQTVQYNAGLRYYASSTSNGPEGLGLRVTFVMLFPK
jgi:hypothetical protein